MSWNPKQYLMWLSWVKEREKTLSFEETSRFRAEAWGVVEALLAPLSTMPTSGSGLALYIRVGKWLSQNRDPLKQARARMDKMIETWSRQA